MDSVIPGAEYQVFLSFRGPDTRQGFADCLYHYMIDAGLRVFRDNEEIRQGEKIEEILRAIDNSAICMPIFSQGYASSKWCLRELAEMVEKKKKIMPIFYDVTPDDVKLKTPLYRDALQRHEDKNEKTQWENALEKVAKIKGSKLEDIGYGELCKLIVKEVLANLKVKNRVVTNNLVEMDESIENMLAYLDIQAPGVRCVVVHGIGGSGKTTLAKTLFNQLSTRFEACSFLADIRESSKHELKHLQKKLIRDLLPKDSGTISDTDGGLNILQERLHNKKVLIVLDDVDKREQIERLAGSSSWFSPGSRIIVTTRDTRVLVAEQEHMKEGNGKKSEELWTLEMGEMNFERALQLFSRHAFKMDYPPSDFLNLSKDVISVIGRLPLALEITGSYLCGKPKEAWEDNRNMMVRIPQKNIQKTLMISSEALDFRAKQIFLDIACLPTKTQIKTANYMWESCGFRPEMGTKELILASIIKVRDDGELWMHDYLKDLGKEIICIENFMDSGMRSRLWDHEEALGILKRKEGSENIQVLYLLSDDPTQKCNLFQGHFRKFRNLRLLYLHGINIVRNFEHRFQKLRWLSWHSCPSDFKATNLYMENLAILDLSNSDICEEWEGWSQRKEMMRMIREMVVWKEKKVISRSHCE
ncbi:TMV resistance protein N-like isoform X2 [Punica granatum]|uniref:TMV resistance protein N-like isoform X2 n=1 Tax=Punica granatum TaxID=22663 RepID=A0A6P8BX25_PUNGR|nr:TMV resistance protein N-like isoform X2 [Punica granatum]